MDTPQQINDAIQSLIKSVPHDGPDILCIVNARSDLPGGLAVHAHNLHPADLHEQFMHLSAWMVDALTDPRHMNPDQTPSADTIASVALTTAGKAFAMAAIRTLQATGVENGGTLLAQVLTTTVNAISTALNAIEGDDE
jgi:hypothetical protein